MRVILWTGAEPLASLGRQSFVQVPAIPQSKHFASWNSQMCIATHKTIKHNETQYLNPTTHKSVYVSVWVTTWSANILLLQVSVWWMCLCNTIWNRPFSNRFSLTSLQHEIGFATTKFDINFRPTGHSFLVTISTLWMQYRILATLHK
jgi:hypothetical protein